MTSTPAKTDWETAYWELMHNRLYSPEPMYSVLKENDNLRELNQSQAAIIMKLELLLSCIRRVGDGLQIDHSTAQLIYKLHKDVHPFLRGLASSKWARSLK